MSRSEFEKLQQKFKASGMPLISFLQSVGVAYTTYNYWRRKLKDESCPHLIAPIHLRESDVESLRTTSMSDVEIPGVTLSFPNGVRAHFGRGSEQVLMDILNKSMDHVQSK